MHIFNEFFDRVVCLSLVERDDKYRHVKSQFETLGIDVEFHRAVIHPFNRQIGESMTESCVGQFNYIECSNEFACSREHYTIIKKAYLEGCQNILVFEDDISFRRDFNDVIGSYMEHLPESWDLLMFNALSDGQDFEQINSKWLRAQKCWGTGAFAFTRAGMDYYLSCQQWFYRQADVPLYVMQESETHQCLLPSEPLIIQNPLFDSDMRNEENKFISQYESGIDMNDYF